MRPDDYTDDGAPASPDDDRHDDFSDDGDDGEEPARPDEIETAKYFAEAAAANAANASANDREVAKLLGLDSVLELKEHAIREHRRLKYAKIAKKNKAERLKWCGAEGLWKRKHPKRSKSLRERVRTAERVVELWSAYSEPAIGELMERSREDILAGIPANHTAARQVQEAVFAGSVENTRVAKRRERKRINSRDHRARKSTTVHVDWAIATVTVSLGEFRKRRLALRRWLLSEKGKTQAALLREWKRNHPHNIDEVYAAGVIALEITKDWFLFQKHVAEHGEQPGQTAFGKILGVNTRRAQIGLQRLERMESAIGPWFGRS